MIFFKKKRVWTKVINSDTNDSKYNQELINSFYKKVYRLSGEVLSLQVMPEIDSEILIPPKVQYEEEEECSAFVNSYPIFYITYSSKKEIVFSEDNFRNFYEQSLEDKVGNFKFESFGKIPEN
jgi:hypothetical protein